MATNSVRTFAAGELSPAYAARADLPIYAAGARTLRNHIIGRHGGAINRPGTIYKARVLNDDVNTQLMRYVSEDASFSLLIEIGEGTLRFYLQGERVLAPEAPDAYSNLSDYAVGDFVLDGGEIYYARDESGPGLGGAQPTSDPDFWTLQPDGILQLATPFTDPHAVRWVQSGRVITLTWQGVEPHELRFLGETPDELFSWALVSLTQAQTEVVSLVGPDNVTVTGSTESAVFSFLVRTASGGTEGPDSAVFSGLLSPLPTGGLPATITWDASVDAGSYRVYVAPYGGVTYFFLGETTDLTMGYSGSDSGIVIAAPTDVWVAPANVQATAFPEDPALIDVNYVVTSEHPITGQESLASNPGSATLPTPSSVHPHTITWDAQTIEGLPVERYHVYSDLASAGTYRYLGAATGTTFVNAGITPDAGRTPPALTVAPVEEGDRPAVAGYFEQRRFFGNMVEQPDRIKASRSGAPSDFTTSTPVQDDDALEFSIAGNNNHAIRAFVALRDMLVMTDGGEWRLKGAAGEPLTPSSIELNQETYVGISPTVRPCVIGNRILYVQARGTTVADLRTDQQVEGLAGRDLTLFASHLFDGYTIVGLDYQRVTHSILWAVRSDGELLGLTYLPELEAFGWHRHDLGGAVEDVCVVPEDEEDAVYFIIERGGIRTIERLANRLDAEVFLDGAVLYEGVAITAMTGLDHLEGLTVGIVAGGSYVGTAVVAAGSVPLGSAVTTAIVGLPIVADLGLLDLDLPGTDMRDKKKRAATAKLLLDSSARTFDAGPNEDTLTPYHQPATDPAGPLFSGLVEVQLVSQWEQPGRVFIRHTKPTPFTVLGVFPVMELGG